MFEILLKGEKPFQRPSEWNMQPHADLLESHIKSLFILLNRPAVSIGSLQKFHNKDWV